MVLTGLEIGSIVIGCVNATLAAAKLLQDWYSKRRERRIAEANQKLAESLKADAASLDHAYSVHKESLPKEHRHRLQKGDDLSKAEIEKNRQKIKAIMKSLQKSIRSSKSKDILPNLQKYLTASYAAHQSIVRSLARLHQRVFHEICIPKSLNPFESMLKKKTQQKHSPSKKVDDKASIKSDPKKAMSKALVKSAHSVTGKSVACTCKHSTVPLSRPDFYVEYELRPRKVVTLQPVRIIAPVYI